MGDTHIIGIDDLRLVGAEVMPFEPAGFDWSLINEVQLRDPTKGHALVPEAMVNSCSECCMPVVNGKPNVLGIMWRKFMTHPRTGHVDCGRCPVSIASTKVQSRDGCGNPMWRMLFDGTKVPLTCDEVMRMETDGTA